MSQMHVVYGFIPDATEPIVQGFGRSDRLALADAEKQIASLRSRPHDSLAINGPIDLYYIRSKDASRVFAKTVPAGAM